MRNTEKPFWVTKTLEEMTAAEWESLCDGCGRCCLEKLEDTDTGQVAYTSVACRFLDLATCRCRAYDDRQIRAPECLFLTPRKVRSLKWLPATCAYRRIADGRGLAWWHPLVSGNPATVYRAGISICDRAISIHHINPEQLEAYIIDLDM